MGVRIFVHRPRVPLRVDSLRRIDPIFPWTRLGRELFRVPYSLVQSSTPDILGLWARFVARRHGCPFVAIFHTALAQYVEIRGRRSAGALAGRIAGGAMRIWIRRYFNRANLILAPSASVKRELEGELRPPIEVLSRGVDCRRFHPRKRTRGADRVRALYVGRVAPEKNLDLLVRVLAQRADMEAVVVGSGPSLDSLRGRMPGAAFVGRLEGESLARAYADADFFVFPSRTDTLGNVVLEAMASGLPVVVTDSMGPKDLVEHGVNGFVAGTDGEFARAVDALAADAGLRHRMGRAARLLAEKRSWRSISERLFEHYERALKSSQASVSPEREKQASVSPEREKQASISPAQEKQASVSPEREKQASISPAQEKQASVSPAQEKQASVSPEREKQEGLGETRCAGPLVKTGRAQNRPLCVLDVIEFFGETSGGVKTYLTQKARCVEERPHLREVLVVPGERNRVTERRGVRWYHIRGPRIPRQRPYRLMIDLHALSGSNFLAPWLVTHAARATGVPVVWFCHSNLSWILSPYPERASWGRRFAAALSRRYMRRLSGLFSATLAASDCVARDLESLGARNVIRVSMGVDRERFHAFRGARRIRVRGELGLPGAPLALYAGRITREKGLDVLLDAWPAIERATGAHLVLVGDGPDRESLKKRCRARNVHWRPYEADRGRLADLMAAVDLYLAPAVVETFGLAALEAMACDTPVLSADRGAVAEHVRRSGAGGLTCRGIFPGRRRSNASSPSIGSFCRAHEPGIEHAPFPARSRVDLRRARGDRHRRKTLRLKRILVASGHDLPLRRLLAITLTCDAACAVTPHRAGGEPARIVGMLHAGIPLRDALLAVASETIQTWPVICCCGAALLWFFGLDWWSAFVAGSAKLLDRMRLAIVFVPLIVSLAWWQGARALRLMRTIDLARAGAPRTGRLELSLALLTATVPLTILAVSARVFLLPVLALTLPDAPDLGRTVMGSFVLIHSQLILPSPSGAGVVDIGFLAELGGSARTCALLFLWRFFVSGLGLALGVVAAVTTYGRSLLAAVVKRTAAVQSRKVSEKSGHIGEARHWRNTPLDKSALLKSSREEA
jgi:glycosyltransferase involved in cell wall biosynthesis